MDDMNDSMSWVQGNVIHAHLVYLEFGPQMGVINKIYNL